MSICNSSVGSNHEDSDITIIDPSILHEHSEDYVNNTYVPIITRLRQANNSSETRQITNSQPISNNVKYNNSDAKHDYIFVDHNPQENARQLEEVLMLYIRDLKQQSKTQLDCDQQLVTRLMDLIRPAYQNDQQKNIALDKIMGEISSLHDKRHVESREKIEQLRTEICQLNKMLCTAKNEQSICNNVNANDSMSCTIHRGHSIHDYDQWTEIEDDAKKLHELVQSQKDQINEIVTLISQTATTSASLNTIDAPLNNTEDTVPDKQPPTTVDANIISSLLQKIHAISGKQSTQEPATAVVAPRETTTLENHSPGVSPSQSLATLILTSLNPIVDDRTQRTEESNERQINRDEPIQEQPHHPIQEQPHHPIQEQPHQPIDIPLTPPKKEPKECPVCQKDFGSTADDTEIYDHIDKCLFSATKPSEPHDYICPNCNRKYPGNDENSYLQHLSDCYNNDL